MSKTTFSISIPLSAVALTLTAAQALPLFSGDSHHYQYKENSYYKKNDKAQNIHRITPIMIETRSDTT